MLLHFSEDESDGEPYVPSGPTTPLEQHALGVSDEATAFETPARALAVPKAKGRDTITPTIKRKRDHGLASSMQALSQSTVTVLKPKTLEEKSDEDIRLATSIIAGYTPPLPPMNQVMLMRLFHKRPSEATIFLTLSAENRCCYVFDFLQNGGEEALVGS